MSSSKRIWNISWQRTKYLFPLLALLLLLSLSLPSLAQGPIVVSSDVVADFPQSITFRVKAQGPASITKIILRYQVERLACFPEIVDRFPDFTPGKEVEAQWTWQMKKSGGLPPGTAISYEWLLIDSQGNKGSSLRRTLRFEDARYPWKSLAEDNLDLFWYQGDSAFAHELQQASLEALERLGRETGVTLKQRARLYIYENAAALQGARIFPQPWEGGVSFPDFATVAIGIPPSQLSWGRKAIAHELAHLMVYQATYNCYSDLPTWLNEGLAMYAEGPLLPDMKARLERAIANDSLLSVPSLASSFPFQTEVALLSYAQSYSLVEFLLSFGQDKLKELLQAFKEGSGYDEALLKVYNLDMPQLDARWRQHLGLAPHPTPKPETATPPSILTPLPTTPAPQQQPSPGLLSCQRGVKSSKDLGSLLIGGLFLSLGLVRLWQRRSGR